MRALTDCLPWARLSRARRDPTDPAPVTPSPRASLEAVREPAPEGLPAPAPAPEARASSTPRRPPSPTVTPLPPGARRVKCSRSTHGTERCIETAHFRYHAVRPRAGRLWGVAALPVSAAARYYLDARGEPIAFTCPLASLPAFIDQTERELAAYWGDTLDTRRDWP